jgi:hypothetical protein
MEVYFLVAVTNRSDTNNFRCLYLSDRAPGGARLKTTYCFYRAIANTLRFQILDFYAGT